MGLINYSGNFNRDSPTTTEVYQIEASQAVTVARLLLGGVQFVGGTLAYIQPATDPKTGLVCLSADFSTDYMAHSVSTAVDSDGARFTTITVQYGIPDMDESTESGSQELGAATLNLGGSMLSLKKSAYTWQGGTNDGETLGDEDTNRFKIVGEGDISIKVNNKIELDVAALANYYGKVNETTFYLPGVSAGVLAGYCRFDGASSNRKFSTDGYPYYEVTYAFAIASHKWNFMFSEEDNEYFEVTPAIYEEAELNDIWDV